MNSGYLRPAEVLGNSFAIETPEALAGVVASTALLGAGAAVARRTSVLAR